MSLDERELLRLITQTASDGIVTIDPESTILFVNAATGRMFGYEPDELLGRSLTMLMPEYLRRLHERAIDRYLGTGVKHIDWTGVELTGLHRDGREIPLEVSFGESSGGGQRLFTGVMRDVSRFKEAERERLRLNEALIRERERLFDVFTRAPAFIATLRGPEHRFEMANPNYLELAGRRDVVGRTVREVLPEIVSQGYLELLDRVYRTGEPYLGSEVPAEIHREGDVRPTRYYLSLLLEPMRDSEGTTVGVFVHGVDVSEQVSARRNAEEAGRRLGFLAEASRILASSLDYQATLGNLSQLAVSNLADWFTINLRDELGVVERVAVSHSSVCKESLARKLREQAPPSPQRNRALFEVLDSGSPRLFPRMDESVLQALSAEPGHTEVIRQLGLGSALLVPMVARERVIGAISMVRSESVPPFSQDDLELAMELAGRAAVAVDNARLFEQTQRLNSELERRVLERTEDLESFSYSVSHDLRAPLRGIDGFSQALLEDYAERLDDIGKDYLTRVRVGAKRMGELIDDLLNLSRLGQGEPVSGEVDLGEIARETLDELRSRDPGRQVEVRIQPHLRTVGDRRLLTVLMENLLGNAWKFTRKRERAVIEVGRVETSGAEAYFVADNGAGFDMEYADRLFLAFQRLHGHHEFEGTGIGLATVKRIVKRHGGSIWAEGRVGSGAKFYFTLGSRH